MTMHMIKGGRVLCGTPVVNVNLKHDPAHPIDCPDCIHKDKVEKIKDKQKQNRPLR